MTSLPSSSTSNQTLTLTLKPHRCPCGTPNCYIEPPSNPPQCATSPTDPNFTFTPQISKITIPPPQIGQTFQTDTEALELYSNFARRNGFLIRKERSKGNPDHPLGIYKRELVCHRAGIPLPHRQKDESKLKKRKKSVPARCKCEAQMAIKKISEGGSAKWVVVSFNNVHNHEFLEGDFANLYSHKYISRADKERILTLAKSGCNSGFIIKSLEMEKKVKPGQLALTEKDIKNFLCASESVRPENEGMELLKYCKVMQERNPEFKYEYSLREENNNNNNKLENILWSYLGAIRGYNAFGDVVIFDNSHKLSNYERPVLAWFGLDCNGNLMFFACAVLFDERPESYKWAFQAFLNIMDAKHPQSILTDLNTDLKAVIQSVLPNTKHAFSLFHINSKLQSWFSLSLGPIFPDFKSQFCKLSESETVDEFERDWESLARDFGSGLGQNRHLEFLFLNRFYWGIPYLKSWFFGGLVGTDHPLRVREFFAGFLDSNMRLKDFVEQVGVAVEFQNQAAEESTANQIQQKPNIKTCQPLEHHASKILTPYSFSLLQTEIISSAQYAVFDASNETYLVRHYLKTGTDGAHMVSCVPASEEINCTCKGFEFSGVLCRHVIRVLSLKNCFTVPDRYVLPRWRKDGSVFSESSGIKFRCKALKSLGSVIMQEGFVTKDRFEYVELHLKRVLDRVREMEGPDADVAVSDWSDVGTDFDAVMDGESARHVPSRGRPRKC